ncbi:MAG: L,D-transpeptidase family protein [Burkholderiales bacterium]
MKILIGIASQTLKLLDERGEAVKEYAISSSRNGVGEKTGSFRTPRGRHVIRAKIGGGMPVNTVFVKRRPTGETYSKELSAQFPDRDWILTRILWLSGMESGFNRLGEVDTMRRYIYIHGTPDGTKLGKPGSHGCIRMRNDDLVDLFDRVEAGTEVEILENL